MLLRSLTFGVWALVAASAVAWGVKLMARPLPVPPGTAVATSTVATAADLTPLFGAKALPPEAQAEAPPPPPPESSRFQLIGVVAARHAARAQGVALIAVDGKTPRAYRVGAVVDGDLVLQAVHARAATIGPRGGVALVSLELPPLPPPSTGVPGAASLGAAPPPNGIGLPVPGTFRPGPPAVQPVPMAQPGMPSAIPGQPLQLRLRPQRFGTLPAGVVMPPAAQSGQDEAPAGEVQPSADGRTQR